MEPPILYFGPYETPKVKIGDKIRCEYRGCDVTVTGMRKAPILWPIGVRGNSKNGSPIVFGVLVDALRKETSNAVLYWWRVNRSTVTNWKRSVGAEHATEGTRKRMRAVGASKRKHGHGGSKGANNATPTYNTWTRAVHRAGGHISARWLGRRGYSNFLADMGEKPERTRLRRIDPTKDWGPGNCRWATAKPRQKSSQLTLTVTLTFDQWSRVLGIPEMTLRQRHSKGFSPEEIVLRPRQQRKVEPQNGHAATGDATGVFSITTDSIPEK